MAYDEEVAQRFRDGLISLPDVSEVKMMGGICFLMSGNMVGGTHINKSNDPVFMFRVGKDNMDEALSRQGAKTMINGSRPMSGFVEVEASDCDDRDLASWVTLAVSFVGSLPPKEKGK